MEVQTFLRRLERSSQHKTGLQPRFTRADPLVEFVFFVELEEDEEFMFESSEVQLKLFLPHQGASLNLLFSYPYEVEVEQTLSFSQVFTGKGAQLILSADILSLELCLKLDDKALVKTLELDELENNPFLVSTSLLADVETDTILLINED